MTDEYEVADENQVKIFVDKINVLNNKAKKVIKVLQENGMMLSGFSPDGRIVEMFEIPEHPWFIGTQAHPEFKSRPNKPHPLFKGFLAASLAHQKQVIFQGEKPVRDRQFLVCGFGRCEGKSSIKNRPLKILILTQL